jgi:hypothetical protein
MFREDGVEIGPIPADTPVNLLANVNLLAESNDPAARVAHANKVVALLLKMKRDLKAAQGQSDEEARKTFANVVAPLLELSKCPDFIVNRGHYFGTDPFTEVPSLPDDVKQMLTKGEPGLGDDDKRALIEFVKTF